MNEHTTEPWTISTYDGLSGVVFGSDMKPLFGYPRTNTERQATRRRFVACVNACKGIPTEALEKGGVGWIRGSLIDITVENALHKAGTPPL